MSRSIERTTRRIIIANVLFAFVAQALPGTRHSTVNTKPLPSLAHSQFPRSPIPIPVSCSRFIVSRSTPISREEVEKEKQQAYDLRMKAKAAPKAKRNGYPKPRSTMSGTEPSDTEQADMDEPGREFKLKSSPDSMSFESLGDDVQALKKQYADMFSAPQLSDSERKIRGKEVQITKATSAAEFKLELYGMKREEAEEYIRIQQKLVTDKVLAQEVLIEKCKNEMAQLYAGYEAQLQKLPEADKALLLEKLDKTVADASFELPLLPGMSDADVKYIEEFTEVHERLQQRRGQPLYPPPGKSKLSQLMHVAEKELKGARERDVWYSSKANKEVKDFYSQFPETTKAPTKLYSQIQKNPDANSFPVTSTVGIISLLVGCGISFAVLRRGTPSIGRQPLLLD